ncbi:angiopoietin-related protein 6-like [Drosophila subpulchrella]|uniref:angiopoietin-related protein 6-like n=1 Tax=Drosophila subpulchrella TaxID=1486046 RepID=UPI0018A188C3|nr:angiopoietin-related protein 6-like [Drosophila subpulchrella]
MKSCIFVMFVMYLLFVADGLKRSDGRKREKRASNIVVPCSAVQKKIPHLVSTNKALRSKLLKCKQKVWCPREGPDGIYKITIGRKKSTKVIEASCKSCGWMVIQRRLDGHVDFNKSWTEYKDGFGLIMKGEYFIGLENLHIITETKQYELFITLRDGNDNGGHARYDNFKIGNEKEEFELKSLGKYSGTAGDSLRSHEKMKFTTFDRDNDLSDSNCGIPYYSGWWYHNCATSNLNAKWYKGGIKNGHGFGISWDNMTAVDGSFSKKTLVFVEMIIKPKSCKIIEN